MHGQKSKKGEKPDNAAGGNETSRLPPVPAADGLSACLQDAIEAYTVKKVGRDWRDPAIMDRIRHAIVAQKDAYWKPQARRTVKYSSGYSVLGYLAYHFPVYFIQTEHLLGMLARDGLIRERMTILDVGTGPGVVPLAIADFWSRLDSGTADIFSIEASEEHIEAFLHLRDTCVPKGGRVSIKPPVRADITAGMPAKIPEAIDLIVFSNVLNEIGRGDIETRAALVMQYAKRLAPDGSILIIEPAEENTSTGLRTLSLALKKQGLTIHSPCTFVHGTNCTPDRCWSFVQQERIRPTRLMEMLAASSKEAFRYINTDIKYSYAVLRKDGRTRHSYRAPPNARVLRLAQVHRHTDKRVNIIASKMSGNLGDATTLMFRVCDGSAAVPVFAVIPAYHVTPENEVLVSAPSGTILELENVLIRHNPAHDAYNLLVSRTSRVTCPDVVEPDE
jgi:SAM-dependent methyltransferase